MALPGSSAGRPFNSPAPPWYVVYWVRRLQFKRDLSAPTLMDQWLLRELGQPPLRPRDIGEGVFARILKDRRVPSKPIHRGRSAKAFSVLSRVESHVPESSTWIAPAFLPLLNTRAALPSLVEASASADICLDRLGFFRPSPIVSLTIRPHSQDLYWKAISQLMVSSQTEALSALAFLLLEASYLGKTEAILVTERALRIALITHLMHPKTVRRDFKLRRELRSLWNSFIDRVSCISPHEATVALETRPGTPFFQAGGEIANLEEYVKAEVVKGVPEISRLIEAQIPIDPASDRAVSRHHRNQRRAKHRRDMSLRATESFATRRE